MSRGGRPSTYNSSASTSKAWGATPNHAATTLLAAWIDDVWPFLVMSAHDDPRGIGITMGVDPGRPSVLHLLAGTPTVVMVLNSVLAGVILALVAFQVGGGREASLVAGVIGFGLALAAHVEYGRRLIKRTTTAIPPSFPSPSPTP